jgi:hypothetical protein
VAAQGEKVDTCKERLVGGHLDGRIVGEAGCRCGEMPAWPPPPDEGWTMVDRGLRAVYRDIPIGTGCTWRVTLDYDRYYRSRTADCIREAPKIDSAD